MSKLYATVESEKATKGQGGQKYLKIHIMSQYGETIGTVNIRIDNDMIGDTVYADIDFRDDVYVNGHHWLDSEVTTRHIHDYDNYGKCCICKKWRHEEVIKGNKQKDEKCKQTNCDEIATCGEFCKDCFPL